MIDANQDKKCERNNKIVEELEKLKEFTTLFYVSEKGEDDESL